MCYALTCYVIGVLPNRSIDSPLDARLESVMNPIILLRLGTRRSGQMCYAIMCYAKCVIQQASPAHFSYQNLHRCL